MEQYTAVSQYNFENCPHLEDSVEQRHLEMKAHRAVYQCRIENFWRPVDYVHLRHELQYRMAVCWCSMPNY